MGSYLFGAILTKVTINKWDKMGVTPIQEAFEEMLKQQAKDSVYLDVVKERKYKTPLKKEDILKAIKDDIFLDIYDIKETEKEIVLEINEEYIKEENLISFLKEQYSLIGINYYPIDEIKSVEDLEHIRDMRYGFETEQGKEFTCICEYMGYCSFDASGIEDYGFIERYLTNLVHISSKNRLVKAVDFFVD